MRSTATPLEAIASWSALRAAWRDYRRGKRRRPEVAAFELNADRTLLHLSRRLLDGSYRHGRYRLLLVRDPKPRLIAVASVADRVVHTAVHRALADVLNRSLIGDTYACLPGRGQHRAVLRFLEYQRRFRYALRLDIRGFFAHVDHQVLRASFAPKIRDRGVLALLDEILASGWQLYRQPRVRHFFALDPLDGETRPHGLPIGNLTSQWWGNWTLNGLDHFTKRELGLPGYLRYMDDFVGFADSPATLLDWRDAVAGWLIEHRRLALKNPEAQPRSCKRTHLFLGFRITRAGYDLRPKTLRRMQERLFTAALDPEHVERVLVGWRGAMLL